MYQSKTAYLSLPLLKNRISFSLSLLFKVSHVVEEVCEALWEHRFHLGASLARERIKAGTSSIAGLLPSNMQTIAKHVSRQPVSARVNFLRAGAMTEAAFGTDVAHQLESTGGLERLDSSIDPQVLSSVRQTFWAAPGDVELLIFSEDCKNKLSKHNVVTSGTVIFQVGCRCVLVFICLCRTCSFCPLSLRCKMESVCCSFALLRAS